MGSAQSGDDLVAGELNGANSTTLIIADKVSPDEDRHWRETSYPSILLATPSGDIGNRPDVAIDGIVGVGNRGGTGVRGIGNQPEGPRGETAGSGTGGDGVIGHGGTGDLETSAAGRGGFAPGTGVLGIGGYWTGPAKAGGTERDGRGGPGVVGVAGGDQAPAMVPSFEQAKGVGVYGTGFLGVQADGTAVGVQATGPIGVTAFGDDFGVAAVGNRQAGIDARGSDGIRATGNVTGGVFKGRAGIHARGYYLPGGTFQGGQPEDLAPMAQVRLVPNPMWVPDYVSASVIEELPPLHVKQLPQRGNAGELLVTIRTDTENSRSVSPRAEATLWFCAVSGDEDPEGSGVKPATWRQVLLGPAIAGLQVRRDGRR